MKISIFGMGYVGTTSAACLLSDGHEIVGIDCYSPKVDCLSRGKAPLIKEDHVSEMIKNGFLNKKLTSSTDELVGVEDCDMIWVCVGTPCNENGTLDYSYLDKVIIQIAKALTYSKSNPLIVIRSTCLPGTTEQRLIPLLEKNSGYKVGKDIDVVFHPEFLREGKAVEDFKKPSKIVIGEIKKKSSRELLNLYSNCDCPKFVLSCTEAETAKYCDNILHALKITYANEVGMICHSLGIDARNLSEVYCSDTKLNISSMYLHPGAPFGGSCLPKDIKAILSFANANSIKLPTFEGVVESNRIQVECIVNRILRYSPRSVGMVGISFKSKTDDVRESPYLQIAKKLIGEGVEVKAYDKHILPSHLIGSNKEFFQKYFRNIDNLMVSSLEEISEMDVILINHDIISSQMVKDWCQSGIKVFDMVGVLNIDLHTDNYQGLYW